MGPDMHVSFGSWDNGKSWQTLKDPDGLGHEMKRVLDIEFSRQNADFGLAIDWNGWVYETQNRGRKWVKIKELGKNYQELGVAPDHKDAFQKGWYSEQMSRRMNELVVDPTNDNNWYIGSGDFWNVKNNHKSAANPHGIFFNYADYGYIMKSTDKGKTWTKIDKGLPKDLDVARIIVNPNDNKKIIMACNSGLLFSSDEGISWKSGASGLPNNLPPDLTYFYNKQTKEFVLYLVEQTVYEDKGNKDGNERETMQYSKDGVNFEIASVVSFTPTAAAPFAPDAFTDTKYGRGFTWGLCHFTNAGTAAKQYSIIARFDCDLSLDYDEPAFKDSGVWFKPEVYFEQGMDRIRKKQGNK